jgi:hypothetical protein
VTKPVGSALPRIAATFIDFENGELQDFFYRNAGKRSAMGLTFLMLTLLLGCYALCAALVLFAEYVIRLRGPEPADAADLPQADTLQQAGMQ